MTDGKVLQTWRDYAIFFKCSEDKRTISNKLLRLGFRMPKKGAPMIRLEALTKRLDAIIVCD